MRASSPDPRAAADAGARPVSDAGRRAVLALLPLLALAACGRKGKPEPPEGADPAYPRSYPAR